jgi:hypothetical protein
MSSRRIGNYQVIDYIGSGGFGSVFKAEDATAPGRIVALKELHKRHTRNAVIKQRFFQEAVAMARLDHPNLPRLYTFGEDNGSYYLVMEFLSGRLLSDDLQEDGPLPAASAAAIMAQVLEALSYAHRNGIIHRDLKPDNIMLLDGDALRVKVLDFGIARMVGGENLTLAGEGFGTPAYMSPERMTGETGDDPRIDIYSAGIILFEMLAGRAPFGSSASDPVIYWSEMRAQHERDPLPNLAPLGVATEIEQVIARAAAKRIEERYATADDMLADLRRISTGSLSAGDEVESGAARLFLTTVPAGADVFVDDEPRGASDVVRGRILIDGLAAGLHTVRVAKGGYTEYRISVSLEEGRQTDLQVALPARSTVVMPAADATAAVGFNTERLDPSESNTALFIVESLPVGATLLLGGEQVGRADEDGRATVKLAPGAHQIEVRATSGETLRSFVTVGAADVGATRRLTLPAENGATTKGSPVGVTSASLPVERASAGKRVAAVVTVILLLAIAAAAYFVLRVRGPDRGAASNPTAQQAVLPPPDQPATPATAEAAAAPPADEKKVAEDTKKSQAEEERAKAEKQEAEKQEAEKATPAATPPPVSPTPPAQTPPPAAEACIGVVITGPINTAAIHFNVTAVEQSDAGSATTYNGRTNARGIWSSCGLRSGNRVRVVITGPRGGFRGSRDLVLAPGRNSVEFAVSAMTPGRPESEMPIPPRMRRPRMKRP